MSIIFHTFVLLNFVVFFDEFQNACQLYSTLPDDPLYPLGDDGVSSHTSDVPAAWDHLFPPNSPDVIAQAVPMDIMIPRYSPPNPPFPSVSSSPPVLLPPALQTKGSSLSTSPDTSRSRAASPAASSTYVRTWSRSPSPLPELDWRIYASTQSTLYSHTTTQSS